MWYVDKRENGQGMSGLPNLGNTCYMNAALQALLNCPPLANYFLNALTVLKRSNKNDLSLSFRNLALESWDNKMPTYLTPQSILKVMRYYYPQFRGYNQCDAQEFLRCFMDLLHNEIKRKIFINTTTHNNNLENLHPLFYKLMIDETISNGSTHSSTSSIDYETCDSGHVSDSTTTENTLKSFSFNPLDTLNNPSSSIKSDDHNTLFTEDSSMINGQSVISDSQSSSNNTITAANIINSSYKNMIGNSMENSINSTEFSETNTTTHLATNLVSNPSQKHIKIQSNNPTLIRRRGRTKNKKNSISTMYPTPLVTYNTYYKHIKSPLMVPPTRTSLAPFSNIHLTPKNCMKTAYTSIVSEIFDGKIISTVECLTCHTVSKTVEVFQDLSLPIPTHAQILNLTENMKFRLLESTFNSPASTLSSSYRSSFSLDKYNLGNAKYYNSNNNNNTGTDDGMPPERASNQKSISLNSTPTTLFKTNNRVSSNNASKNCTNLEQENNFQGKTRKHSRSNSYFTNKLYSSTSCWSDSKSISSSTNSTNDLDNTKTINSKMYGAEKKDATSDANCDKENIPSISEGSLYDTNTSLRGKTAIKDMNKESFQRSFTEKLATYMIPTSSITNIAIWLFDLVKKLMPFGPPITLQDCLSTFFACDELNGDNMYSCETCKKLRNGIKESKILALPEILCIHFKRFRHDYSYSSKVNTKIEFPLEGLDLTPYLDKHCMDEVRSYDLIAAIVHHGTSLASGHYTTFALNASDGYWYEYDDDCVTRVKEYQVEKAEPYVLFYAKNQDDICHKRLEASKLQERQDLQTPSKLPFYISKQWLNKFNHTAEPGPIDQSDYVCIHRAIKPQVMPFVDEMCQNIGIDTWIYLFKRYGGDGPMNSLQLCKICEEDERTLMEKRKLEQKFYSEYMKMHYSKSEEAQLDNKTSYLINLNWFKQWEDFVKGAENDPPGPIDNKSLLKYQNEKGQNSASTSTKKNIPTCNIGASLWKFLLDRYQGGPEILANQ